jgi:hypothetical protein
MFQINTSELLDMERRVDRIGRSAVPIAVRYTLSAVAAEARSWAAYGVAREFINRNQYTARSIRYDRAERAASISAMRSEVGSTEEYMGKQEEGAVVRKRGKHGVSIPTPYASGESAIPRRRMVRQANRRGNRSVRRFDVPKQYGGSHQGFVVMARKALESGAPFVVSDYWSDRPAVFRVVARGRIPKGRGLPSGRLFRSVHTMRHAAVTVPQHKWLRPAADLAAKNLPNLWEKSLQFQLDRVR